MYRSGSGGKASENGRELTDSRSGMTTGCEMIENVRNGL